MLIGVLLNGIVMNKGGGLGGKEESRDGSWFKEGRVMEGRGKVLGV